MERLKILANHSSAAWSFQAVIPSEVLVSRLAELVTRKIVLVFPKTALVGQVLVLGQVGSVPMNASWLGE